MRGLSWSIARGVAAFFGAFSCLNLVGDLIVPGFDASAWWIDFGAFDAMGPAAVRLALLVTACALTALAVRPKLGPRRRLLTLWLVMALMACAFASSLGYFAELTAGRIYAPRPLPVSALVFLALCVVHFRVYANDFRAVSFGALRVASVVACAAMLFPLTQMVLAGKTDYRRPADAVVVFGARVYPNGKPSLALADRTRTASRLVTSGRAKWLVVSGGPGDRGTHETQAMRRLAIQLGVPADRILVDRQGLTTQATVENSVPLLRQIGARRVLAVSHFYHLPRVKLAFRRAGIDVHTVPATETRRLRRLPWFMAREVAALWAYYLLPLQR